MLGDLQIVEDKLYQPEALDAFLSKYTIHDLIRLINKTNKKQTRDRIRYSFSKIGASHRYQDLLCACLDDNQERRKEFGKFVASEHSEQFYLLLENKPQDVLQIMDHNQAVIPIVLRLVAYEHGIKLVRMFSKLYQTEADKYECLFHPLIQEGLSEGLGFVQGQQEMKEDMDTVAQMRYFEIVVNVSILGGKCFQLVSQILQKALLLYKTKDILLKMAMVQIISGLGEGLQTSKLLKEHSIWTFIEKDACDPDQELYVKKFLLVLMIDMSTNGHYDLSHKMVKSIQQFLAVGLKSKGEELEAAIDIISHLFKALQGIRIVVQNMDVLSTYVALSRSTKDSIKKTYYESLVNLTSTGCSSSKEAKEHPKYKLAINILNCVGKPNLVAELSHNLHANNYMIYGLDDFSQWFASLLQLPFQESELLLIKVFHNILNFYEVAQSLLQVKDTTKYLLRQPPSSDINRHLRESKMGLIKSILQKGKTDWQGLELSEFTRNLQKLLQNSKKESVYALDVE